MYIEIADERQLAVVIGVIKPVAHHEFIRHGEPDKIGADIDCTLARVTPCVPLAALSGVHVNTHQPRLPDKKIWLAV